MGSDPRGGIARIRARVELVAIKIAVEIGDDADRRPDASGTQAQVTCRSSRAFAISSLDRASG